MRKKRSHGNQANYQMSKVNPKSIKTVAVTTISKAIDSQLQPADILQKLNAHNQAANQMLLESSEIESRQNVKSILMLKAALRIECQGRTVTMRALTSNGESVLSHLYSNFSQLEGIEIDQQAEFLSVHYPPMTSHLDEDSRLKQVSPIDALRLIQQAFKSDSKNPYAVFLCGVFAFDFIASFEQLPSVSMGDNTCPDFVFYLAETMLVIDHQRNMKRLFSHHFNEDNQQSTYFQLVREFAELEEKIHSLKVPTETNSTTSNAPTDITKVAVDIEAQQYQQQVKQLKNNIIDGDIFQVVPSRSFSLSCECPLSSYQELKRANPSPYMFFMKDEDFVLFGASPESALKYDNHSKQVQLYPIAGTRPRGKDDKGHIDLDLDARIEAELKLDQKELAEHMMLVDLARNDVARISEPGTTHVPRLLAVDRYSQVMHLVSLVQGELRQDLDALHAYQACMNMGTLTGAPKIKASQLIREVENKRRGSYGGAVGYINGEGDMDTCIVIRSAFYKDGRAHIQAGAGIVYDSDPEMETLETENKAKAVIGAIQRANLKVVGGQS